MTNEMYLALNERAISALSDQIRELRELLMQQTALVEAEREACAKIAETWSEWMNRKGKWDCEESAAEDIAAKIRARGKA